MLDDRGQLQVIEIATTAIVVLMAFNIALADLVVELDSEDPFDALKARGYDVLGTLYLEEINTDDTVYKSKYYNSKLIEYVSLNQSQVIAGRIDALLDNSTDNIKFRLYLLNDTAELLWYQGHGTPSGETTFACYNIPVKYNTDREKRTELGLDGNVLSIKLLMWW